MPREVRRRPIGVGRPDSSSPQGHRFVVAKSWKRAGKSACPRPGDRKDLVLERLAECLEHRPLELEQLGQ